MGSQNRDLHHLRKLQDYYTKYGTLPSYSRISKLLGFKAKNAAFVLGLRLKSAGYVRHSPGKRLTPTKRFFERQIVSNSISAGFPSDATEGLQNAISLDQYLVSSPSRTVLVKIKCDSMIDAGILPGDIVVVEKQPRAEPGDIVIAIVDNAFTVKRLAKERRRLVLKPENKGYPILRPKELKIFGIIIGNVRKYK